MQYAKVQVHKQKPLLPEVKQKIELSLTESCDLTERELHCPYCGWYINTIYSDCSGHFKAKCYNCKEITVFNLSYFRRHKRFLENEHPCNLRSPTATGAVVNGHSAVHQRSA